MKTFKVSASAKAHFSGIVQAATKNEAEEKFREKCERGEVLPEHLEFLELESVQMTPKELAADKKRDTFSSSSLPVEIWDRMDRYDYYTKLGYVVAKIHPTKPQYLYSRKEKMIENFIGRLENMTADDCFDAYCQKNMLLGTDDKNKIRAVLIQSILDDARNYAETLGNDFREQRFRKAVEHALSRMPNALDRIIAQDRKKMNWLMREAEKQYAKRQKVSEEAIGKFLEAQGIKLPKETLADMIQKIGSQKKKR